MCVYVCVCVLCMPYSVSLFLVLSAPSVFVIGHLRPSVRVHVLFLRLAVKATNITRPSVRVHVLFLRLAVKATNITRP